jgi:hypothetical protein
VSKSRAPGIALDDALRCKCGWTGLVSELQLAPHPTCPGCGEGARGNVELLVAEPPAKRRIRPKDSMSGCQ